jgi:hypothetical protein
VKSVYWYTGVGVELDGVCDESGCVGEYVRFNTCISFEVTCTSAVAGDGQCIGSKTYGSCFVVRLRGDFFICNMLSLGCVMRVERNNCEHDKLDLRGIMVEIEVAYHQTKKFWYLYVTSICTK